MKRRAGVLANLPPPFYTKKVRTACTSKLNDRVVQCPTGTLKLVACTQGMHSLTLSNPAPKISSSLLFKDMGSDEWPSDTTNVHIEASLQWLRKYFLGDHTSLKETKPALCPNIFNYDSFRSKVWCILEKKVEFGQTVSYGELASLCKNPRASQAIGSAMRNNPLSLIVPCHRVILSSGKSGNYAGGKMNNTKVWLLEHEKQAVNV